jgi:hypothetical protein
MPWGYSYGPFPGGDPREFVPDGDACTPEEIARWETACAAWDRGDATPLPPGCSTFGDGSAARGDGFGLGVGRRWLSDDEWRFLYGDEPPSGPQDWAEAGVTGGAPLPWPLQQRATGGAER